MPESSNLAQIIPIESARMARDDSSGHPSMAPKEERIGERTDPRPEEACITSGRPCPERIGLVALHAPLVPGTPEYDAFLLGNREINPDQDAAKLRMNFHRVNDYAVKINCPGPINGLCWARESLNTKRNYERDRSVRVEPTRSIAFLASLLRIRRKTEK